MTKFLAPLALLVLSAPALAADPAPSPALAPSEIVAAAPKAEWVAIAPPDLLVMDLAPPARGPGQASAKAKPRRVVIQLMPPPFSQGWIGNIRKLAAAHWWDGLSVNRVQDNYVVQWGDADGEDKAKARALPGGLESIGETRYEVTTQGSVGVALARKLKSEEHKLQAAFRKPTGEQKVRSISRAIPRDPYSDETLNFSGWPIAVDQETQTAWPVHCYGMVGVGRDLPPNTGSGAELYTVIGHAPRHLDRNMAVVGRVIEGIEHLSSLPRGTGALGFYETPEERTTILSIRLGTEVAALPAYEYLSTESETFARYADARANRRDPFFINPAGGADICNIPVPVRRAK